VPLASGEEVLGLLKEGFRFVDGAVMLLAIYNVEDVYLV
jgi:hypothetical protein